MRADPMEAGNTLSCRSLHRWLRLDLHLIPSWQLSRAAASGLTPRLYTAAPCWGCHGGPVKHRTHAALRASSPPWLCIVSPRQVHRPPCHPALLGEVWDGASSKDRSAGAVSSHRGPWRGVAGLDVVPGAVLGSSRSDVCSGARCKVHGGPSAPCAWAVPQRCRSASRHSAALWGGMGGRALATAPSSPQRPCFCRMKFPNSGGEPSACRSGISPGAGAASAAPGDSPSRSLLLGQLPTTCGRNIPAAGSSPKHHTFPGRCPLQFGGPMPITSSPAQAVPSAPAPRWAPDQQPRPLLSRCHVVLPLPENKTKEPSRVHLK